jgi:hypothetical protein
MRIDQIELSGSLFVTSSASIILGQTKISSDNNGSISFTNVSNPTQKVIGSYSGSFTGSIKLPTVPQGAAETNILLVNGSGNVVYRSNLSLTGAQGNQGTQGIQGIQGTVGTQGFQGFQGDTGAQGTQGTQGIQGTAGTQGIQGTVGAQGSQGAQGIQGTVGTQGATGASAGITSYTNPADNRVLTSVSSTTINAESNLIFDGTNLGIGVTPSAWRSGDRAFQIGNYLQLFSESGVTSDFSNNTFINSSGQFTYINTAQATRYRQYLGEHQWLTAPSGTAGNAITFTQAMTLDASGRLGIGTTSPGQTLEVKGADGTGIRLMNAGSGDKRWDIVGSGNDFRINETGVGAVVTIKAAGNVGIGTTSPSSKLDVVVTDGNYITISPTSGTNNNNSAGIRILGFNGIVGRAVGIYNYNDGSTDNNNMLFYTNYATTFSEKMRITSGGNVGIGTTSPLAKLHLNTEETVSTFDRIIQGRSAANNSFVIGVSDPNVYFAAAGAGGLRFAVNSNLGVIGNSVPSNVAMTILSTGNVGIGTESPAAMLDVRSTMRVSGDGINFGSSANDVTLSSIVYTNATGGIDVKSLAKLGLYSAGTERIHITTGGNVGISRTPTTNALEVNGDASKTTAGDWLANSDSTIKTEIHTIDGALDRINKVRLVSFKYKDEYKLLNPSIKDKFYQNVIAQEYQEIYPDYVYESGDIFEDKNILQVDTNPMYIDAVASIQQLSAQVDILKQEIINLKNN